MARDLAIDLGTANTLVYVRGRGVQLRRSDVYRGAAATLALAAAVAVARRQARAARSGRPTARRPAPGRRPTSPM